MAEKTLISMDRDRLKNQRVIEESSSQPDVPNSLSSEFSTSYVSHNYSWPVYQEPSQANAFAIPSRITSIKSIPISQTPISALASFSMNGITIEACGSDDGYIRYINSDNLLMIQPISYTSFISALTFDSSSELLIAATGAGELGITSLSEYGSLGTKLKPHSGTIWSVHALNGSVLTASMDHTSRVIDLEAGKVKQTFKGFHSDSLNVARFWASHTVLTGSADKTVCLWDLRTGTKVSSWYNLPTNSPIIDISDLGNCLFACATAHGTISVCDKDRVRKVFSIPESSVNKILRLSSNLLAIACDDGTVKFLDNNTDHLESLLIEADASILNISRRTESSIVASTSTGSLHILNFS